MRFFFVQFGPYSCFVAYSFFLPKNNVFKCGMCKSGDDTVRSICCQHLSTSYFGGCSLQKKEYNVLQHMRSVSKFVIIDDPHCTNGMEKRFLYLVVFHRALMLMCSKSCSVNLKIRAWFKLRCCSFFLFFLLSWVSVYFLVQARKVVL